MPNPNCYGHAVRYDDSIDPGGFAGGTFLNNASESIKNLVLRDGLVWAGATQPVGPLVGHYLVACRRTTTNTTDYHWFRQEAGGNWTHKPGEGNIWRKDASEVEMVADNAPEAGNFDFGLLFTSGKLAALFNMATDKGWAVNYDQFIGYWYCPNGGLKKTAKTRDSGCAII